MTAHQPNPSARFSPHDPSDPSDDSTAQTLPPPGAQAIEACLEDAEVLMQVQVTVHDWAGAFHDETGRALLGARRQSHRRSPLCELGFGPRCRKHCLQWVHEQLAQRPGGMVHTCWKGLCEVAVPLMSGEVQLATLFAGPFASPLSPPDDPALSAEWRRCYAAAPNLSPDRAQRLARLLWALGRGLWTHVQARLDTRAQPASRPQQILRFIQLHAAGPIRLQDLASALHLSPSRAGHVVRQELGLPFQELVKRERILRAKVLLQTTDLTIRQIAQRVGLDNEYYFNRLFAQVQGQPPGRYRQAVKHKPPQSGALTASG